MRPMGQYFLVGPKDFAVEPDLNPPIDPIELRHIIYSAAFGSVFLLSQRRGFLGRLFDVRPFLFHQHALEITINN